MAISKDFTSIPSTDRIERLPSDAHRTMLSYLSNQSIKAFSQTCRDIYLLTQSDITQLQFLKSYFPLFKPPRDSNGALTISASQYHQRLSTAHSMGLKACCLKSMRISNANLKDLKFTPDGRTALLIDENGMIKLLDLKTAKVRKILAGHSSGHCCLQITLDQKRVLSESSDNTLKLWDLQKGQCLQTLIGHTDRVNCLQITSDGTRALSASFDYTLKFWNLETGRCLWTFTEHNSGHKNHLFFSGISHIQITPDGRRALTGTPMHCTLQFWDLETGQCLQTLFGHKHSLKHLQITPDGTKAISACSSFFKIWDLSSDKCLEIFSQDLCVDFLQITPDGTKALTGSNRDPQEDYMTSFTWLRLWDLETGQCVWTERKCNNIMCLQISPDGTKALWADRTIVLTQTRCLLTTVELLDLKTGLCLESFLGTSDIMQFSLDGTSILLGSGDQIEHWTFYSLLEERITRVARVCFSNFHAEKAIAMLPEYAQNHILVIRSSIIRWRISSRAESWSFPCMGRLIKKCARPLGSFADRLNIYKADVIEESVNTYNATQVALPSIRMCFLRALKERNKILLNESIERVANLQPPIKNVVYKKLYEIHLAKKAVPQPTPPSYGESAFLSKDGCSVEDRIEAITQTIENFKKYLNHI